MVINKKVTRKSAIKASNIRRNRRPIKAAEEEEVEDVELDAEGEVNIDPAASDLLFEAEDVAELVAEITGKEVAVTAEDDVVTFEVGDDQFVVESEGDEEILESSRKALRGKKPVRASKRLAPRKAALDPARRRTARK